VSYQNKWEKYLIKESYILNDDFYGKTVEQFFELMKVHSDKTFIFFDTETTGLSNKVQQLTEIGAIAADADNWQFRELDVDVFHEKIKLSDVTKYRMKKPAKQDPKYPLKLTRYGMPKKDYEEKYGKKGGMPKESEVLLNFYKFIESQDNVVLVAQNASFDINFVNERSRQLKLEKSLDKYPVFDTMVLIKMFHNPLIKKMADEGHPRAIKILKTITKYGKYGNYVSASMGPMSQAYSVDTKEWHNALADVKMMMKMTQYLFNALIINADTDIEDYHNQAVYGLKKKKKK
jgi:DNA polymerase III epsilon subunit-like protein